MFTTYEEIAQEITRRLIEREPKVYKDEYRFFGPIKAMEAADGFKVSVQANETCYCSPRENPDRAGFYYAVECGYPSDAEDLLMEYAEEQDNLTETVYGYVPFDVVVQVFVKHGGLT